MDGLYHLPKLDDPFATALQEAVTYIDDLLDPIGIIGAGRIGGRVIRRLGAFGTPKILVNDNLPNPKISPSQKLEWTSKETIFKEADVISLHVPLTPETKDLVSSETLSLMKKDAILINTARGDLVDEQALKSFLDGNPRAIACLDVFRNEPYRGDLLLTQNAILTSHMGSMTLDCRSRMEIEATQEALRFANGCALVNSVPQLEYALQKVDHAG